MALKFSNNDEKRLRRLLSRAINKNQITILKSLNENRNRSINNLVSEISERKKISPSTIKLNIKILRELKLIDTVEDEGPKKPKLTKFGKAVLKLVSSYVDRLQRTLSQSWGFFRNLLPLNPL